MLERHTRQDPEAITSEPETHMLTSGPGGREGGREGGRQGGREGQSKGVRESKTLKQHIALGPGKL